jgi:hypothetical protein
MAHNARRHSKLPVAPRWIYQWSAPLRSDPSIARETIMNPYVVPVGAIVAGVLVLLMPRLLNYIVALALIGYGLYELNKIHTFITI